MWKSTAIFSAAQWRPRRGCTTSAPRPPTEDNQQCIERGGPDRIAVDRGPPAGGRCWSVPGRPARYGRAVASLRGDCCRTDGARRGVARGGRGSLGCLPGGEPGPGARPAPAPAREDRTGRHALASVPARSPAAEPPRPRGSPRHPSRDGGPAVLPDPAAGRPEGLPGLGRGRDSAQVPAASRRRRAGGRRGQRHHALHLRQRARCSVDDAAGDHNILRSTRVEEAIFALRQRRRPPAPPMAVQPILGAHSPHAPDKCAKFGGFCRFTAVTCHTVT